jgi:hypothetical protein
MGWRAKVALAWRQHRLLFLAFVMASVLAVVFIGRTIGFYAYWATHKQVPIEEWMTIGYIARSYDIDRGVLRETLGLNADQPDRRTLAQIAASRGMTVGMLIDMIEEAIARARAPA